jgi:hypothetical protein
VTEPWRCSACQYLMYNLDEYGYPAAGAPTPHMFNKNYPKVCSTCRKMLEIVYGGDGHSQYFVLLESIAIENRRKMGKLKPGSDYL